VSGFPAPVVALQTARAKQTVPFKTIASRRLDTSGD
jgi:hypothetical protein